ncbi:hypothetical protein HYC85_001116 [Camellia sinensis]|uniref:Uncharacterized protein n=1 Tax=Camellia sinensis TaxID=4442 RepID=A0A7J7I5Q3_CAMSI|nr:hypothetical protein HYC85_001116 [Camellia sinensis]
MELVRDTNCSGVLLPCRSALLLLLHGFACVVRDGLQIWDPRLYSECPLILQISRSLLNLEG